MGWFDEAGRWVDGKYEGTKGWVDEKYEGTKEWGKKNADDIDLITDFIPGVGQVKDAYNTIKFGWRCYKDPSDENILELGFMWMIIVSLI